MMRWYNSTMDILNLIAGGLLIWTYFSNPDDLAALIVLGVLTLI